MKLLNFIYDLKTELSVHCYFFSPARTHYYTGVYKSVALACFLQVKGDFSPKDCFVHFTHLYSVFLLKMQWPKRKKVTGWTIDSISLNLHFLFNMVGPSGIPWLPIFNYLLASVEASLVTSQKIRINYNRAFKCHFTPTFWLFLIFFKLRFLYKYIHAELYFFVDNEKFFIKKTS